MKKYIKKNLMAGQTLVTLLVFVIVAIIITTSAVMITITNSMSADKFQQGIAVKQLAESGIENALLKLLRDPNYASETISVGDGNAIISVTGDINNKTIISEGKSGNFSRKVQTKITYNNDMLVILSWEEIQ